MTASLELPTVTHSDRLKAAAARTAAARQEVDEHSRLAAEVDRLKTLAADGELDDKGAADLVAKTEKVRIGEITAPRRQRALDDALAHEIKAGLEILSELSAALEPVQADAAAAADKLTEALVDPAAAALPEDTVLARELGVARCSVEKGMPGVFPAAMLAERIKTASTTTWGALHVPVEAAQIVATFDAELVGIRAGTAMLKATLKTVQKISAS
jgi:hypothetical protein